MKIMRKITKKNMDTIVNFIPLRFKNINSRNKLNLYIFITLMAIYVLNQIILKKLGIFIFNYYLNDLIFIPLYLSAANFLFLNAYSIKKIMVYPLLATFLSEFIASNYGNVFDWWDIVCYFTGAIVYYCLMRCKNGNKR